MNNLGFQEVRNLEYEKREVRKGDERLMVFIQGLTMKRCTAFLFPRCSVERRLPTTELMTTK